MSSLAAKLFVNRLSVKTLSDHYLFLCFLALLFWAPIPLASNRLWSAMLLVFVSAALCFVWLILYLKGKVTITPAAYQARWAILSLVCFQAWVFVQSFTFTGTQAISINSSATLQAGVLGLGLLLSFVMALLLINSEQRKHKFYMTLIASGVFQACIGIMLVFINHDIFPQFEQFFYAHKKIASGTFINSNHFSAYLNLCLALAVGLLLSQFNYQAHTSWRHVVRASIKTLLSSKMRLRIYILLIFIGILVSQSRMGNVGFFAALGVTLLIVLFKQKTINIKIMGFLLSLLIIDVLIVGSWFGFDKIVEEVQNTDLTNNERTEINANSITLLKDTWLVGVGAGGYQYIEPSYSVSPSVALTVHAHNDYLEFLINTGVVGCLFLVIFLYCVLKEIIFSTYGNNKLTATQFSLIMLLVYVALHSLVDFNLHIPAFSFTLLACLAMIFVHEQHQQKGF